MPKPSKPTAAERTVDLFTGKSKVEAQDEALRISTDADVSETAKSKETIEEASQRWREAAFVGQEWTTQHFGRPESKGRQYRLTLRNGWAYLEQTDSEGKGAYHYGGIMFPEYALPLLADVIVPAARTVKGKAK